MEKKNNKQHWNNIYTQKLPQEVSWFQKVPTISLKIIQNISDHTAQIIDVGGGTSLLVDHLLKLGYANIAVLDLSGKALEQVKKRLAGQADKIEWYEQDITQFIPPHTYDIWHDRAVLHFLIDKKSRKSYVNALKNTLKPGGHAIIATFAKEGPKKCSGLEVMQYDDLSIQHELGNEFTLLESHYEIHLTPNGTEQRFIYFVLQRN